MVPVLRAPHLGGKTNQTNVTSCLLPWKGRKVQSIIRKKKFLLDIKCTNKESRGGSRIVLYLVSECVIY